MIDKTQLTVQYLWIPHVEVVRDSAQFKNKLMGVMVYF
jgi:hypothetical protein